VRDAKFYFSILRSFFSAKRPILAGKSENFQKVEVCAPPYHPWTVHPWVYTPSHIYFRGPCICICWFSCLVCEHFSWSLLFLFYLISAFSTVTQLALVSINWTRVHKIQKITVPILLSLFRCSFFPSYPLSIICVLICLFLS
jgi:hypothetical protein